MDAVSGKTSSGVGSKRGRMSDFYGAEGSVARRVADDAICLYFAALGVPENQADNPLFRNMIRAVAAAGGSYVPPKRKYVGGAGLQRTRKRIEEGLDSVVMKWPEKGVTIASDMMSDRNGRAQANFLCVNEDGAVFMESVDCGMERKTGGCIASLIRPVIMKVGSENVVALCMDGASNYAAATQEIVKERPHIEIVKERPHIEIVKERPHIEIVKERPHIEIVKERPHIEIVKERPHIEIVKERHIEIVKERPHIEIVKERPHIEIVKERPHIEIVKERPHIDIVKERPHIEIVKERPHIEIVKERPHIEIVKERPHIEIVKERPHIEIVKERLHIEIVKERPQIEIVKERPHIEIVKERPHIEIVKERPHIEIVKERPHIEIVKERPHIEIVKERLQYTLLVASRLRPHQLSFFLLLAP
ncbi:unnamed protein product [Closterium sp. NIES-64]|nr:unnamed protein product [Closterium sp. NIES-64]